VSKIHLKRCDEWDMQHAHVRYKCRQSLFGIRGGTCNLRSLTAVAKIIRGILEKCVVMVCRTFQWIDLTQRDFYAQYNEKKGFFNSCATNIRTIRNRNREVKWEKKWNKLKVLVTGLLICGSSDSATWLRIYVYIYLFIYTVWDAPMSFIL